MKSYLQSKKVATIHKLIFNNFYYSSPVSKRRDEVEAAVDTVIHDVSAVQAALVVQVALELVVDVGDDGVEAGKEIMLSLRSSSRSHAEAHHINHHNIKKNGVSWVSSCKCGKFKLSVHFTPSQSW